MIGSEGRTDLGRYDMNTDWVYRATNVTRKLSNFALGATICALAIYSNIDLGIIDGWIADVIVITYGVLHVAIAIRPRRWMYAHGIWLAVLVFGGRAIGFVDRAITDPIPSVNVLLVNGAFTAAVGFHLIHLYLYRLGRT